MGRRESGQQIGFPESFRVIPSPPEDVLTQPMLLQGSSQPPSDPASGLPAPLPTLVSLSSLLSSSLALLTLLQGLEPRPRSPPLTPTCTVALGRPLPLSEPPWPSWGGWLPESRLTLTFQASWPLEPCPPFSLCLYTPLLSRHPPISPSPRSALLPPAHPSQRMPSLQLSLTLSRQQAGSFAKGAAQSFAKGPLAMKSCSVGPGGLHCPCNPSSHPMPHALVYFSPWLFSSSH